MTKKLLPLLGDKYKNESDRKQQISSRCQKIGGHKISILRKDKDQTKNNSDDPTEDIKDVKGINGIHNLPLSANTNENPQNINELTTPNGITNQLSASTPANRGEITAEAKTTWPMSQEISDRALNSDWERGLCSQCNTKNGEERPGEKIFNFLSKSIFVRFLSRTSRFFLPFPPLSPYPSLSQQKRLLKAAE